jgi:hypothetical protein
MGRGRECWSRYTELVTENEAKPYRWRCPSIKKCMSEITKQWKGTDLISKFVQTMRQVTLGNQQQAAPIVCVSTEASETREPAEGNTNSDV